MRIIHKASLVFLLKDVYSKNPITNAVILCNGKQNPYTRKSDGHYVFSNLYPGNYDIEISCKGYAGINFSVNLKENETQILNFNMSYTADNSALTYITRFDMNITHLKQKLISSNITLKLKNEASFLKMIEPAEQGSSEIKLNLDDMVNGIMGQQYLYTVNKKNYELCILGYDKEKKCYTLEEPLAEKLEPEGKFYPVWHLKTDSAGRLIMPIIDQFMKDDTLVFELTTEELRGKASFDVKGLHQSGQALYADVKLRKIPKKHT